MIALRAIAPLHHPLNRYVIIDGALRRVFGRGLRACNAPNKTDEKDFLRPKQAFCTQDKGSNSLLLAHESPYSR